jgi:glycogen debranching enzyme
VVCLLHDAWRWGLAEDDVALLSAQCASASIGWPTTCCAATVVRYIDESGRGLANQGWKGSSDAIQSREGRLARPPSALCEVQGYAYEAPIGGAELLEAFGLEGADRLRQLAV